MTMTAALRVHGTGFRPARLALHALLMVLLLGLVGCPTVPQRLPPTQPWEERRAELQTLDRFAFRGRVAVAAGEEGFNARLRWQQEGAQTAVALDGPLGVGGVQVTSDGEGLVVVTSRGERFDRESAAEALQRQLGFDPPLASLRYWILGVPDPSAPAQEVLDEAQRLAGLEQHGWQITYGQYAPVAGRWMPQRMTLQREGVRVRVIVDQWEAGVP